MVKGLMEFAKRHTHDMREFFRDDKAFGATTKLGFALFITVCAVRTKRNHYDIYQKE